MSFRLFGVPVSVRGWFWLTAALLGLAGTSTGLLPLAVSLPMWVAVVFVSVLVHEFGHAFAIMRHGLHPEIVLHGMGGHATHTGSSRLRRLDRALISLAGPGAGFLLGGLALLVQRVAPPLPLVAAVLLQQIIWVNIAWGIFNLIPVLPFDGGHVMQEAFGPRRARTAAGVSLVVAVLLAAVCVWLREPWGMVLFVMSAMQSYQLYNGSSGATFVDPGTMSVSRSPQGGGGASGFRRWWLKLRLKYLQSQAATLGGSPAAPRRPASSQTHGLRLIKGGADDPPKDKRLLN